MKGALYILWNKGIANYAIAGEQCEIFRGLSVIDVGPRSERHFNIWQVSDFTIRVAVPGKGWCSLYTLIQSF